MARDRIELEEGREIVRRTIVGGRPRARKKMKVKIPIGIEKVLCRAAMDPEFYERLKSDRADALASLGDDLEASELAILATIPASSLDTMIDTIDVPAHGRRRFMKSVAATVATAAAASLVVACEVPADTGSAPEPVDAAGYDVDVGIPTDTVVGSRDYTGPPPEQVEVDVAVVDTGVMPDDVDASPELVDVEISQPYAGVDVVEVDVGFADTGILPDAVTNPADIIEVDPGPAGTGILPDME